jgi:uncharacterized protein YecT (DUF1311 family)
MKRKIVLLSTAILFCACQAHAASQSPIEQRYSATYSRCMATGDAAQGITSGMIECTEAERNFQDGKLNQAYKMVMSRLPANRQDGLRLSERNWIKARDANCERQRREDGGGSMSHVTWLGCLMDETIKRTISLEHYR